VSVSPVGVALIKSYEAAYRWLVRPLIFRTTAQDAHERLLGWLRRADAQPWLLPLLGALRGQVQPPRAVMAGGVLLESPVMIAAGLVKGEGFESEADGLRAVATGRNIMPGWRSLPRLVGPVEFGSFTRWPRLGNPGVVAWRDVPTRSTQNRIGLKNPGAKAAAAFLGARKDRLPRQFGINLAVSPGVSDPARQTDEIIEALAAFADQGVKPSWFTLNISCPNTEDDPRGHQTARETHQLCAAAREFLRDRAGTTGYEPPLWVKVGPNLGDDQYRALMAVFAECGVRAVVATNTLPLPVPGDPAVTAGVGGGLLHDRAVEVAALLVRERQTHGYPVDVIACGGVQDGATYRDFARLGIAAMQLWSALVYRGPLASALVTHEGMR